MSENTTVGFTKKRVMRTLGVVLGFIIMGVIGYINIMTDTPPGGGATTGQGDRPDLPSETPDNALDCLRLAWDSEGYADWPAGKLLAEMSDYAYLPPDEAEAAYRELGFEQATPVVVGSMHAYVVAGEDVAVVVFRGTDDVSDWLANLTVTSHQTPHGAMHEGFAKAYASLKPGVMSAVMPLGAKYIWTTGHSLGGALAVACAYDLIEVEGMGLHGVMTFGQPMVAKGELAAYLDTLLHGRYARVVNGGDIVARVPPTFSHCGSMVWFTDGGVERSLPKTIAYRAMSAEPSGARVAPMMSLAPSMDVSPMPEAAPMLETAPMFEAAPVEAPTGPVPLSLDEFEQLQAQLRSPAAAAPMDARSFAAAPEPELSAAPMFSMSPEPMPAVRSFSLMDIPFLQDHRMQFYLERIVVLLSGEEG